MKRFYDESMRYVILYKSTENRHDVLGCSSTKEMADFICRTHNDPRCYYMENLKRVVIGTPNIDYIYEDAFAKQNRRQSLRLSMSPTSPERSAPPRKFGGDRDDCARN